MNPSPPNVVKKYYTIPNIQASKRTQQSDSVLTFQSLDTLYPRGLQSSIFNNNNNVVDLDLKKRTANKIDLDAIKGIAKKVRLIRIYYSKKAFRLNQK